VAGARLDLLEHRVGVDLHPEPVEVAVQHGRLEGELHVVRHVAHLRDECDVLALAGELLGDRDPHVVALVLEHEHAVADLLFAPDHLVRGQLPVERCVGALDHIMRRRVEAVGGEVAARRDDHDLGPVLEHVLCGQAGVQVHVDVLQLVELDLAVVDDPLPLAEPPGRAAREVLLAVGVAEL
jgi:hypothetical protein